ncbi:DinB family protein [Flexivirga sp.]|uniref:DinB family protein n=1 Tax=Flexivirga sp. TaxID=1962927 RepID=UPI003F80D1B3
MATDEIVPDSKDWTWVLERPCPECGFEAGAIPGAALGARILQAVEPWPEVLRRPGAARRNRAGVWSDLEYGAHVRDVCRVFDRRLRLMLDRDDPQFDNWDQDAAAVEGAYAEQSPSTVAAEIGPAADTLATRFDTVPDDAWRRTGRRAGGSTFTVLTLGRYCLHDLVHHLHDVGAPAAGE